MKKTMMLAAAMIIALNLFTFAQSGNETLIEIKTSKGNMTAMLYNDTPQHRDNFIKLINEGWYEGSEFHRVIWSFMIQGGANAEGKQDPGYTIPAEILPNHFHKKGALAAARQPDQVNPQKSSSGCQFYIVQGSVLTNDLLNQYEDRMGQTYGAAQRAAYTSIGGSPHLDGGYTVFGEVITGFEVIDAIAKVQTDRTDHPEQAVVMSVTIVE